MKKLAFAFTLLATSAFAQQPQPAFAPYTIDEKTHNDLMHFLGEQPFKVAGPIVNFLAMKERDVQAAAAKQREPEKK